MAHRHCADETAVTHRAMRWYSIMHCPMIYSKSFYILYVTGSWTWVSIAWNINSAGKAGEYSCTVVETATISEILFSVRVNTVTGGNIRP